MKKPTTTTQFYCDSCFKNIPSIEEEDVVIMEIDSEEGVHLHVMFCDKRCLAKFVLDHQP